jgi:hypothetical protein
MLWIRDCRHLGLCPWCDVGRFILRRHQQRHSTLCILELGLKKAHLASELLILGVRPFEQSC